ncbi:GDNF family receptor alpha-4-like [Anguilla anguilla]|uniref:GDNF family receptor alpha-4-like n=1 Tax=Anguilla anguilla TaxID=7936 RepID=UPI0015B102D3|nr:GDNF family receptor alpha-4-like [Anguilla anguilla]
MSRSADNMIFLGVLLNVFIRGSVQASTSLAVADCLEAERSCAAKPGCGVLYQELDHCASAEALSPLGPEARHRCLKAQSALEDYRPLLDCKCQRGVRHEAACLKVYWTVRFSQGREEYDVSPYEDVEQDLVRNIGTSRMASIVSASSLSLDGQNQCLKAAQDCGLFEKCGSLRSEYVVACTKRAPGSAHCNRQKCHRALRRFLERVPAEYSLGVLFCPCTDALCGERRRKTIVPSCSYQEREGKPNCLSLEAYCMKDELCRSRLADFQYNCHPSPLSASGCLRENGAACLKAYAGLIGTIMTPNYVSNSSVEVSQWCSCEGSGNQWRDCLRILEAFSSNGCLRNAISAFGSLSLRPEENTPPASPRPSPKIQQGDPDDNVLPDLSTVEDPEEEEDGREFNVIPNYSEKESNLRSGVRAGCEGMPAPPRSLLVPLLLTVPLSWG